MQSVTCLGKSLLPVITIIATIIQTTTIVIIHPTTQGPIHLLTITVAAVLHPEAVRQDLFQDLQEVAAINLITSYITSSFGDLIPYLVVAH